MGERDPRWYERKDAGGTSMTRGRGHGSGSARTAQQCSASELTPGRYGACEAANRGGWWWKGGAYPANHAGNAVERLWQRLWGRQQQAQKDAQQHWGAQPEHVLADSPSPVNR